MWTQPKDLTGQRFGKLIAIERVPHPSKRAHWRCRCDCGQEAIKNSKYLLCGDTTSCGCDQRAMRARGHTKHGGIVKGVKRREYVIWRSMKSRCYTKSSSNYRFYGANGITICERWRNDFAAFLSDMGPCPDGFTIERLDSSGPYAPENCCWADWATQHRNTSRTLHIRFQGRDVSLHELAEASGVNYFTLHKRIQQRGESPEHAVQHDPKRQRRGRGARRP